MAIDKGVRLGPYEILSRIGEGGMGEVWRARDSRIGREVAVKVLADAFDVGDAAVRRFEQEARAAGALNHPGLVTIFDVGTTSGSPYIVMELLEGTTLRDAIGDVVPVALPLRKAVDYAIQITSALAVAHEKGIIHRDLKPENLFITSDDRVKILDFGLAKLAADAPSTEGALSTARHLTTAGIAIGTPGYMSPEQVRALPLDHRTDIFSLGSVMYEMLCGKPAFECFSAIETMNAVLNSEPPPLTTIDPSIPAAIDAIVHHCLEKKPQDRFQSARDLAFQLRTLSGVTNTVTDAHLLALSGSHLQQQTHDETPRRVPYKSWAVGAVAALALAIGGWALFGRHGARAAETAPRTFKQLTFADGVELFPTLAPDGKSFAYVSSQTGNRDIYVQRVDGRGTINITSDSPDDDSEPAFSPDGDQIAFRSERGGGGIFVMGVTGESVRRLSDVGHNPSWSPDGTQLVVSSAVTEMSPHVHTRGGELWIIDTRTGAKRQLYDRVGEKADALQPSWSPHGQRIAFWGVSLGQRDVWTIDPHASEPKSTLTRVTMDPGLDWNPVWSPDGKFLYFGSNRDGTMNLWRMPMDEETGKPTGDPEPMSLPAPMSGDFSVAQQQGAITFTTMTRLYRLLALPFDASTGKIGEARPLFGGAEEILSFDASPNGDAIAFTTSGVQEDVFIVNADGSRLRQLTNDAARDRGVSWSPDGNTLYFYSNREGPYTIWSIHRDGSGLARVVDANEIRRVGQDNLNTPKASPDGRTLATNSAESAILVHLDRPRERRLEVIADGFVGPEWSPDGTQLVATPGDSGGRRGVLTYSLAERPRRVQKRLDDRVLPRWLGNDRIVAFAKGNLSILELSSGHVTNMPLTLPPGVDIDDSITGARLSRDHTTLYVRQALEQSDVWLMRFNKE
ncbi:MAG TPA: protein kinase [Thermoanaerobaculia bacterium]|nr:protein kinase [Thermoanaerobaculia bacterium]